MSQGTGTPGESYTPEAGSSPGSLSAAAPLSFDERRTWRLLRESCVGAANATKQKHLAFTLGISVRYLQDILKRLTEEHGKPIASSCREPMGTFVPETENEVNRYVQQLRSRALSDFKRIAALNRAAAHELLRQQRLEFGDSRAALRVAEAICASCGEPFEPSRSTQIYCSPECRFDAARARGSI